MIKRENTHQRPALVWGFMEGLLEEVILGLSGKLMNNEAGQEHSRQWHQ